MTAQNRSKSSRQFDLGVFKPLKREVSIEASANSAAERIVQKARGVGQTARKALEQRAGRDSSTSS